MTEGKLLQAIGIVIQMEELRENLFRLVDSMPASEQRRFYRKLIVKKLNLSLIKTKGSSIVKPEKPMNGNIMN